MAKVHVSMIFEILGRPQETVTEALETIITRLSSEKGVKITEKKIHEPIPVKEAKDIFTAFAEVNAELDSMANYFGIIFAYMPSNIEITEPQKLTITNQDLNDLAHVLVQRLHNYDAVVKQIKFERITLLEKIKEISPETYKMFTSPPNKENKKQKKSK